jgi:hypothetical protein
MTRHRNTADAYHPWSTYISAREEARRRGDRKVGTDHLVLGLLHEPTLADALATDLQSARDALDELDRESLSAIGLSPALDAPPIPARARDHPSKPTLKAVLQDRLPLTPSAKKALQTASRPMRRGHRIVPQQVLEQLLELERPDPAAELFGTLGIDRAATRARLSTPAPQSDEQAH